MEPVSNGGLSKLREYIAIAKDLGMPWFVTVGVIMLATGVIPSPLYSKVETLAIHVKMFEAHIEQSRDVVPLLRMICRNGAKTDAGRIGCEQTFGRGQGE